MAVTAGGARPVAAQMATSAAADGPPAGGPGPVVLAAGHAERFREEGGAQGQAGGVGVQPQAERLAVQRGEGERQPSGHTAIASPAAGALARCQAGRRGCRVLVAAWSWPRASSAAWSIRTSSSSPAVSDSAPVLTAR